VRFTGLHAFPLTPLAGERVDEAAFVRLVERLAAAGVDGIGALGSTGNYAYLSRTERARVARLAVDHAGGVPVTVCIGGLRTRDVLEFAEDAQQAGVSGVLMSAPSYQKLSDDELFDFFAAVTRHLSVPLCVYDNPGTTHSTFSDALHGRIAALPGVASIKLPGMPDTLAAATDRVARLRALVRASVTLGVSGDGSGVMGLLAGCTAWYSAWAGLFPEPVLAMTRAALGGDSAEAFRLSAQLQPVWDLFARHGSLRVIATAAVLSRVAGPDVLPAPLRLLPAPDRDALASFLRAGADA
jgi:4-hydroxy-tetrahydrodipicolinate synthase